MRLTLREWARASEGVNVVDETVGRLALTPSSDLGGDASGATAPTDRPFEALGFVLPIYDPMLAMFGRLWAVLGSPDFDDEILARAGIQPGHRVLDVGCGTGRLAVRAQQEHPQATVVGFDPDPAALARARNKAQARGVQVRFDRAYADALPYPDASFDRLLCSLMIRLLAGEERRNAFTEMRRVLTPTGSLHLVDFGDGEDVAAGLQQAGFTRGTLTRLNSRLAPRMAILDARP